MASSSRTQQKFSTLLTQSLDNERKSSLRIVTVLIVLAVPFIAFGLLTGQNVLLAIGLATAFLAWLFYRFKQSQYKRDRNNWLNKHMQNRNSILWVKPELNPSLNDGLHKGQVFVLYTSDDYVRIILQQDEDYEVLIGFLFVHSPFAHCGSSYAALRHFEVDTENFIDNLKKEGQYKTVIEWFKYAFPVL
jgi:hypothetical protein